MNYKRIIIISLILLLLSMACVSASDNQTSDDNLGINNINAINIVDDDIDDDTYESILNNISEDNIVFDGLISSSNDDVLSASNYGTLDELKKLISNAKDGSTIKLDKSYKLYMSTSDDNIKIDKSIVIDGNGNTINVGGFGVFTLDCKNSKGSIEIKNINFVGGDGCPINVKEGCCAFKISYCNFTRNSNSYYAGAIMAGTPSKGSYILNCNFKDCYAYAGVKVVDYKKLSSFGSGSSSQGGAIFIHSNVYISDCKFEGCSAGDAGAIMVKGNNNQIINCVFTKNYAGRTEAIQSFAHGGAIYIKGNDNLVRGCTFTDNKAERYGGAISVLGTGNKFDKCTFNSNYIGDSVRRYGGAIYAHSLEDDASITITNCAFNNNGYDSSKDRYCKYGGAIYFRSGIKSASVSKCNFTGNAASKYGGAVYTESGSTGIVFTECIFTKNSVPEKGGAIYLDSKNSWVKGCLFYDQPNALYCDNKECRVYYCSFLRNSNYDIWSTKSLTADSCWFGNTASNRYSNLAKLQGKAASINYLYLSGKSMDTNYLIGVESTISLNMYYNWELPTSTTKLTNFYNAAIPYTLTATNAEVTSKNNLLVDGKTTITFKTDTSKSSSSITMDCCGVKLTFNFNVNPYSLSALKNLIDSSKGSLNLTHNYYRDSSIDKDISIVISKDMVINGNGYTINSNYVNNIFNVQKGITFEINNLNFVNCTAKQGGAIQSDSAKNIIINNCSFINCTSTKNGGALMMSVTNNAKIINSTFINNIAGSQGGSIAIYNGNYVISDCLFINSHSGDNGCFISVNDLSPTLNISNSIFLTNSSKKYIYNATKNKPSINVENCWFGDTNDNITNHYNYVKDLNVKNWVYLDITAPEEILVGNSAIIDLKFYSMNLNTKEKTLFTKFKNMIFDVISNGGEYNISSNSILISHGEGLLNFISTSNDYAELTFKYYSFNYTLGIIQYNYDSFLALQHLINSSGSVLNLTNDYTFNDVSDYKLIDGISINKNLTINGNNHVLNGCTVARIFNLGNVSVVLNNITFINGNAHNGGAIITDSATNMIITSCRFENNSAWEWGGAIYSKSMKNTTIESSVFKKNSAESGGAIFAGDAKNFTNSVNIITSNFTDNSAASKQGSGGAIFVRRISNLNINGNFINNTADSGGAIEIWRTTFNIKGVFKNNKAFGYGGAVLSTESRGISNVTGEFYENVALIDGSAIYALNNGEINVINSIFVKNGGGDETIYAAGAYYINIHDSIFLNNNDSKVIDSHFNHKDNNHIKATNNWFGNTVDNMTAKPKVHDLVELDNWLFLDVEYDKTDVLKYSINNITFSLKSYDNNKGSVSDYAGNLEVNMSLKSDNGIFDYDNFILGKNKVVVVFKPESDDSNNVVVFANFSKYSCEVYDFAYNVVTQPSDSFYNLQYSYIDHVAGNVVYLPINFRFYENFDDSKGLIINKDNLTIDGGGCIIDGKDTARIFNILADNVVLKNIAIVNGNDFNASAIYASGKNITIMNCILLNNSGTVINSINPLNASYNWWGNTAETFNQKANVSDNVIVDNALFANLDANSKVEAGKNTTVTLNLTNLYNFNSKTNSTYLGLDKFKFNFDAVGGKVNVTSDKMRNGTIPVSFESTSTLYGEIYAKYNGVVINHEFDIIYDDDSFIALFNLINKTKKNGVVNLTHDYMFYSYDVDYVNGIPIEKALTINANGFNIFAMGKSSVFDVRADNVSILNVNFYDAVNAVQWKANNGLMDNVSADNCSSVLYGTGSNLTLRNSNFTNITDYCILFGNSNSAVDNCVFKNNNASSILAYNSDNLKITYSLFEDNSMNRAAVQLDDCSNVTIADSTFINQNNKSINILGDSSVYLSNNTLSSSNYIFNNGTILSQTYIRLNDLNSDYMVGDVILLNATIYDDNENIILVDEFNFNIDDEPVAAELNIDSYEYLWTLTNGTWLVVPDINENLFANCTVDSLLINVLKYNSSVVITSISDIIYGEDAIVGFEFENSSAVLVSVTLDSEVVFNETTNSTNVTISALSSGLYKITIATLESEYYASTNVTSYFRVYRADSTITLGEIADIYYGEDLIINFTVENRTHVIASIYDTETKEFVFNGDVEGDSLIISNLSAGSYSITLSNFINENYNPSGDYDTFVVLKVNSNILLDNQTDYIYGNVSINYTVDNLTNVMVIIDDFNNGNSSNFTTTNSTIILDLDAGYYMITVINIATDDVFESMDDKIFYVLPADSSVEIDDIGDVYYGDDFEINFKVINATTVNVIVKDENNTVVYEDIDTNETYIYLSNLSAGKYTVEVYNNASDNYNPSNATKTFTVVKAGSLIEYDYTKLISSGEFFALDYDVENETVLNICIYDSQGNIIYNKNFNEIPELPDDYTNLTENAYVGFYSFYYRNLTVGNYTFEFSNLGNYNISGYAVNGSFEVIKATSSVEILVDSIVYGEDLEVYVGVVNVTVVNMLIEDADGEIVYNDNITESPVVISNLAPGNYTVTVTNYDSDNIIGNSTSQEFCVYKISSAVEVDNISDIYYGDDVLIEFDVENRTIVNVKIKNQNGEVVYDKNITSYSITVLDLNAGNYTVTVTNLETAYVNKSSDSKSFNVLKRSIDISVIVEDTVYGNLTAVNVISDIDDLFTVYVNNQKLLVSVVDGYGTVMINLDAGNYTAYVDYTNDNYDITFTNASFEVAKADVNLSVKVLDKVYTADIEGNVFADVDGNYTVVIAGKKLIVNVKDGIGLFNIGSLSAGNYSVSVSFDGNDNYNAGENSTSFEVTATGTNFNIIANASEITFGDVINVTQSLPGDATGSIVYYFENGTIIAIIGVNDSFVLSGLDAGSYVVYADYSGDDNYDAAEDSITIIVNKATNNILVFASDVVYGENTTVIVLADVDGEYTVYINGRKLNVNVKNGIGTVDIALNAGSYEANIEYVNNNYENNVTSIPFVVSKANISLSIDVLDKVYTADIEGNVFSSLDGNYTVVIGDKHINVIVEDGIASFDVGILSVGNYSASVSFDGNDNYNACENSTSFEVTATGTNFNIVANTSEITYGEDINISQSLPSDATGSIVYYFENGTIIAIIGVNDSFVLSGLDAGSYVVYADYSGDDNYDAAEDSLTITVSKATNNIVVFASDVVYGENSSIILSAGVDGEYIISIDGIELTVNVVDGIGEVETGLNAGTYEASVYYVNDNYENSITSVPFVVSKADISLIIEVLDNVYTADIEGNVFASIDGNYTVVTAGKKLIVNVKYGVGSFNIGILSVGNYSASVSFDGDDNYNDCVNSTSFEVTSTGTNFNIVANASEITYGKDINVSQSLPGDATGNVTYKFANGTVIKVVDVGESFVLSGLNAGSYVIYAVYSGDDNYASAQDSFTITVGKAINNIVVYGDDVIYPNSTIIHIFADIDGEYAVIVNGKKIIIDVEDGYGEAEIPLDAGNYSISVEYQNDNYENEIDNYSFVVSKADISLIIEVLDKVYSADIEGNIFATLDGEYTVVIDDNIVQIIVKNGVGSFNMGILNTGTYIASVIFEGNDNYNAAVNKTSFNVTSTGTNFNIVANASEITYGEDINVSHSLPGDAAGNVTYKFANGTVIKVVDVGESFVLSGLDAGSYVVYAVYSGDDNYASAEDSFAITVGKAVNNIVVFASDVVYGENSSIIISADVDGQYVINLGSIKFNVSVVNGIGEVVTALNASTYKVNVEYVNDNYENNITSIPFVVSKADISLIIEVLDKVYTANIGGNVFADIDGEYIVLINNKVVKVTVKNGIGSFNVGILSVGNYNASVSFEGNDNYNAVLNKTSFKVTKTGTNFNIVANASDITYGEDINVSHSLPGDATGNVTYKFANGTVIKVVDVGESFVLSGLNAGSHVIYAVYSGDDNNAAAEDSFTITVGKAVNNIVVYGDDVIYPNSTLIHIFADIDGEYAVIVNGKKSTINVVDGYGEVEIALDAGNYSMSVEYQNNNYENDVDNYSFVVSKADILLSIKVLNTVYGANVGGNVFATLDGEYAVLIGNKVVKVTVKNGVGSFNVGILSVGNYIASVSFEGNDNYNPAVNKTSFKVASTGTNFNIVANASDITYGEDINVSHSLPGDATGSVTYSFANGTLIKVVDVGESFVLSGLDAGSYVVYAVYSGDDNYASAEDTLTITVGKAINNIVVSASDVVYGENSTVTVLADVDGEYVINIDGIELTVDVVDGIGEVEIGLNAGTYKSSVYYVNDNYENNITSIPFVVSKADISLIIEVLDKVYTADIEGNVFADIDGEYSVLIGNKVVNVTVKNGVGSFNVGILSAGNYSASVSFEGNDNYNSAVNKTSFKVTSTGTNFYIVANASEITYGEDINVSQSIPGDATGNVTYKLANGTVIKIVDVGESFVLSGLDAGSYVIYAVYSGDDNYASAEDTLTITVGKATNNIVVSASDVVYGENSTVTVSADVDGEYIVNIDGVKLTVNVVDGIGEVEIGLNAGTYKPNVYYVNDNYENNITGLPFVVSKADISLIIEVLDKVYTADIEGNVFADIDGEYTVLIDNKVVKVTVKNAIGSFNVGILSAGNYSASVSFEGNDNYNAALNKTSFKVTKTGTNFNIVANTSEITQGEDINVSQNLPGDATGNVTYKFANGTIINVVDVGESFVLSGLDAGSYVIYADYSGDNNYAPAEDSITIVVDEQVIYIVVSADDLTKYYHGSEKLTVNVSDNQGVAIADKEVIININGVNYTRTTDENGIAFMAINLGSGEYIAVIYVDDIVIEAKITVLSTVNGTDIIKVFMNGTQYYATFRDSQGNYLPDGTVVEFNINGVFYNRVISGDKGLAKLNINLMQGEYIITAMNSVTGEWASNNITVISKLVDNHDLVKYYKNESQYTVKVIGDDGNPVGAGVNVTFNINGVFYTRQTDESGIAKLNINLAPGDYIITAEYDDCKVSNKIKVLPILSASDMTKVYGTSDQFIAHLLDGQGNPYSNQKVQFNINGVLYYRTTDSSGNAKLNINLMPGEYIITSSYNGMNIANIIKVTS